MFWNDKMFLKLILMLALTLVATTFIGCSDDDDDDDIGEHVTPWGFVLYDSGVEVARYFQGDLDPDSEIEVPEGGMTGQILVYWIDQDGDMFDPMQTPQLNEGHHHLEVTVQDEAIAGIFRHGGADETEDWEFHVTGQAEGETGLKIALLHHDHYGFKMPEEVWVPIHVHHSDDDTHGPPVGLIVKDEESGDVLVTATDASVQGTLTVAAGSNTDHLIVEFFDANDVHFQPDADHHSLTGEVAHPATAEFESHADDGEPWAFQINGLQAGSTTLVLTLMHESSIGFEAAVIPIQVQ